MPTLIAGIVAVAIIYALLNVVKGADPKFLARVIKLGGGVLALAVAIPIGLKGELAVAIPLGLFGAGLLGWAPFGIPGFGNWGAGKPRSTGQTSHVRSAFLEVTLDHDTGAIGGRILAGAYAGENLDSLGFVELAGLAKDYDEESRALLESYLDRRFAGWREDAQSDRAGRNRSSAASGKMSDEEAYQILGLQPGAGRDEIGRAHRMLMKKLHPDQGGSTYLAARVNEAKDTLLRTHRN